MKNTNNYLSVLILMLAFCLMALPLQAEVPVPVSYQGYLTDAAGDPVGTGMYNITFSIYDNAIAGVQKWISGVQSVSVNNSKFDYLLGSSVAFPTDLFATNINLYLEIQVSPDPPLVPRTKLVSVPFAHRAETIGPNAKIGSSFQTGNLDLFINGSSSPSASLSGNVLNQGHGGSLRLSDETGGFTAGLESDFNGTGGYLFINRSPIGTGFRVDGNYSGTEEPMVTISGSSNNVTFDMGNATEDNIVQFPNNSVNSVEILDEPGVASNVGNPATLLNTSMTDIKTVTITIPSPGYIYVTGRSYLRISGATTANFIYTQIDETSGGTHSTPYRTKSGMSEYASTNSSYYYTPTASRIFYKTTAGTYTFILEGLASSAAHTSNAYDAMVTAMYFPTSYGTVTTFAGSPGDAINAEAVQVVADEDPSQTKTMNKADLRYLELKVAKEKADLLKAERDLAEAQNAIQGTVNGENKK